MGMEVEKEKMCTFNYFDLIQKYSRGEKLSEAEVDYLAYIEYTEYIDEKSGEYIGDIDWDLLLVDYEKIEDHLLEVCKENGEE